MKWSRWLERWDMTSLKLKSPFLEMEWSPKQPDRDAAWELYVELLTRITTQPLRENDGDELTALNSVYSLFAITRSTIKSHGKECIEFTKLAVVVLNQIIRPFTAKWHKVSVDGGFDLEDTCQVFRKELRQLQEILRIYTRMLADMAEVEDLTELEE